MENYLLLPQSKLEEFYSTLQEIKSLILEINNKSNLLQDWISESEAQKLLGLKETSLWSLRKRKLIVSSKIGSKVFIV